MSADDYARSADRLRGSELDEASLLASIPEFEPDPWRRPGTGLLVDEVPLRHETSLALAGSIEHELGLAPSSREQRDAVLCFLGNLVVAHARSERTWVFYSRDRNNYGQLDKARRYFPTWYTYRRVIDAVDALERTDLVLHRRTRPSPSAKFRSRIMAAPHLLARLADLNPDIVHRPVELVVLRGANGLPIGYRDTRRTEQMRLDIRAQNGFLDDFHITVEHPEIAEAALGFICVRQCWLDPRRRTYHRIFNGNFSNGGRWYGPWWQQLPSDIRSYIRIDGAPIVELDFRACHLRLLYARRGVPPPFDITNDDPYNIPGHDRSLIKLAFNVMLNAQTRGQASRAIAKRLAENGASKSHATADGLMRAVFDRFPQLCDDWCTGIGLQLQNTDAEICRRVQQRMRKLGVPILSVHDSFIVPQSHTDRLSLVMDEEMQAASTRK